MAKVTGSTGDEQLIDDFIDHIWAHVSADNFNELDHDVSITIGGVTFVAYDNAQFIQSLVNALTDLKEDIS